MSILEVSKLTFSFGNEKLYLDASMRLFEGEHAVLVGPNGTGKSTLLKLLDRLMTPDQGKIEWVNNKRIGYLDQYAKIDGAILVKDYLYDVFKELFAKEKQMEKMYEEVVHADAHEQEKLLNRATAIGDELINKDFYAIKSKVGNIIHGLGLTMDILDLPIKKLSGGMRAKIILGKLLLEEADVLLLDEPTNFLDIKHIDWLTKFLIAYPKAFIVISHHEAFLSAIATTVFALENGQITRYKGDFEYYLKEKELRYLQHEKAFVSQAKMIEKTEDFIKRNIARASTTKRAQSRRKMLDKVERLTAPRESKTYHFRFPISGSTGRDVLKVKDLEIGYQQPLLEPLSMIIMKEEKVVITGKNGVGKSTFIKTVLDKVPQLGGTYEWIDTATIAYFSQEESYANAVTPFTLIHHHYPHFTKKEIMHLLGHHGISYEMANRSMQTLSGGEQTKVRLAILYHQKGNVLILDEPTNHLDVEAKDALKTALNLYEGTLILISHEKEFYQEICDYEISLY